TARPCGNFINVLSSLHARGTASPCRRRQPQRCRSRASPALEGMKAKARSLQSAFQLGAVPPEGTRLRNTPALMELLCRTRVEPSVTNSGSLFHEEDPTRVRGSVGGRTRCRPVCS